MSRFINPYTDFGFKKLFGEEVEFKPYSLSNKNILSMLPLFPY